MCLLSFKHLHTGPLCLRDLRQTVKHQKIKTCHSKLLLACSKHSVLFSLTIYLGGYHLLDIFAYYPVSAAPCDMFRSIMSKKSIWWIIKPLESRDGAVVRALASHQCGPGSNPRPGVICGLSLLLVLVLAPRVFRRVLRFSSLLKNQHF